MTAGNGATEVSAVALFGASAVALFNEASQALLGVPIGIVLAAAAGAFFGRTFIPSSGFGATVRAGLVWTIAGAYTFPLAMHLLGFPSTIAASVAFVLAWLLQLVAPALVPVLVAAAPAWLRGRLEKLTGSGAVQQGDDADEHVRSGGGKLD